MNTSPPLVVEDFFPPTRAAREIGCHRDTAAGKMRTGKWHAHNKFPGTRSGSWWLHVDVARALRRAHLLREPLSVEDQESICGCTEGAEAPSLRGIARARYVLSPP